MVNSFSINSASVNSSGGVLIGSGSLVDFEQESALIGAGSMVSYEQSMQLRLSSTVSESFIDVEQSLEALSTGNVVAFQQRVKNPVAIDHLSRSGWDLTLVIGGYTIPVDQITGNIEINRTENDASLLNVSLIPPTGIQDVESYHGKTVVVDVQTASGTVRVFTGVVDIPELDIMQEQIKLRCTDKRTELLNSQLSNVVSTIGVYSPHIFRPARDTAELVEQRLTTTSKVVDFDAHGNYAITSWFPKSTPDYTLTDSDVYRERPLVEFTSRGRVLNKVNITFQYRYERFFHATRSWQWTSPINPAICNLLQFGYSLTHKASILAAIDGAGWPLKEPPAFTAIHPSGWYRCSGTTVGWSTTQLRGTNVAVTDENGNQVSDTSGNPLYETTLTGATDYSNIYCMGATWKGTKQWSQSIQEDYTLTVSASQSQAQFGTISNDVTYAMEQEANSQEWEGSESFSTVPGQGDNYYIDQDLNRDEMRTAMDVAIQQAKNNIIGSHRDTRVSIKTFIFPEVDLKHTVLVDTDELEAKGKVFNIKHKLNVNTGEATTTTTLLLIRSQGSSSDSSLTLPSVPTDNVVFSTGIINLGNHFGQDPTTTAAAKWNGAIGNRWITVSNNTFKTDYQEQFIVDTPAIEPQLRNNKSLTNTASYNVSLPNDTLVITFDGK